MSKDIKIVPKAGAEPLPTEIVEQAIVDIATAAKKLTTTRLKDDVIVLLISRARPA